MENIISKKIKDLELLLLAIIIRYGFPISEWIVLY